MNSCFYRCCRGAALLVTLLLLSMLSLLGIAMTNQAQTNLLTTRNLNLAQQNRQLTRKLIYRAIEFIKSDIKDVTQFNWKSHAGIYGPDTVFKKYRLPRRWQPNDYVHTGSRSGYTIEYLGTVNFVHYIHGQGRTKTSQVQVFRVTAISYGKRHSTHAAQVVYSRVDPMTTGKQDQSLPTGVRSWTEL